MEKMNLSADDMNNYLNKKSGMLGLSGVSNDLRDVLEAAEAGNERAQLALDVYVSRVKGYLGNYIALLNGCDCLVFTAGVGENSIEIRKLSVIISIIWASKWMLTRTKSGVKKWMKQPMIPRFAFSLSLPTKSWLLRDTYRLSQ